MEKTKVLGYPDVRCACMKRLKNLLEAKEVCMDREAWRSVLSEYPVRDTALRYLYSKYTNYIIHVGCEISSDVTLLDYLRNTLELRGTKYMCREAGCGACVINASTSPGTTYKAINSCMVSITSCQDWEIKTIEGLGNKLIGYHPLQKAMGENNATQCGHCTPGWVMSMNGLLESTNKNVTMLEVEQSFGGNICRCTGYRPIVECLKKFAKDAPKEKKIEDIEDLYLCKDKNKPCDGNSCADNNGLYIVQDCDIEASLKKIILKDNKIWYRPSCVNDVLQILQHEGIGSDYMLVAGNTAKGAVPIFEYPSLLIDISHLQELKTHYFDQNLVVGAGLTLADFLSLLKIHSKIPFFSYLEKMSEHINLMAHIAVRNVGTIAGNLMIKHKYNGFQSDIFLLLETVGAELTIIDWLGHQETYSMQSFLSINMNGKIIFNVLLPPLCDKHKLITFKIMPRAQNARTIVQAGFLYKIEKTANIVMTARIVIGGLSAKFIRAYATETFLIGRSLFTNDTLHTALQVLDGELIVEDNPPEPSVKYRRHLAKTLFYKGMLTICPPSTRDPRYHSGTLKLHESRGLSKSKQIFSTDPKQWPLTQPIQKVEALYQSSGEAIYTEDLPSFPNEVFAAFVLSDVAVGTITKIDASQAMKLNSVIAFYTAKDIPGLNSFTPIEDAIYTANEEVFADSTVKHYHQPIGIIVAETQHIAERASKLVNVVYGHIKKPVVDIKKAKEDKTRNKMFISVNATNPGTDVHKVITGSSTFYGQYHFTMETLVTIVKPTEEGLEVHSATQWVDGTQIMISRALCIDQNKIDVYVRRVGGAYGLKISRSIQTAVACSLVSFKLNRPCRVIQPLTTVMEAVGKRFPYTNDYEVAVNKSGVIQYINYTTYSDNGYKVNELLSSLGIKIYNNCYDATKFNYSAFDTLTDTAKNTWCRSPGTLEAIAACEGVMERISYELSLDPITVRLANLDKTRYNDLAEMVEQLKNEAEYVTRRADVDYFNAQNRWKKRGLRFSFARWRYSGGHPLDVNLSVFHADGSILITHGGVEMGQGLNTKVVQIAAYFLKVAINKIQIKTNSTIGVPNSFISGGSITGQNVLICTQRCCEQLLARLEPIKATLSNPTWEQLINAAYNADVDLQVHGFVGFTDELPYDVYGVSLSEVEIDCLTGEYEILRVDLLQDVGVSLSPEIDIGQVEGGFIMAVGYWTCEKLVYKDDIGKLLTNRTWNYHVPGMRDIPQEFNIYFRKNSYSYSRIHGSKACFMAAFPEVTATLLASLVHRCLKDVSVCATGEPSTCAAVSVTFALREAITMARQEAGIPTTQWFEIDGPYSTEAVAMATNTEIEDFKF